MCRELTPWRFVVNCLFVATKPIRIDDEFWKYTYFAAEQVKQKFENVEIVNDHYSLEDVIYKPILLKVNNEKRTVELDKQEIRRFYAGEKQFLEEIVNYGLDGDIKKGLPSLMEEAYKSYARP